MRVLVCGSRDFHERRMVGMVLDGIALRLGRIGYGTTIIHGAAQGADTLAAEWALDVGCEALAFPADWDRYGKRAGYIRNKQMLDEGKPDLVVAFYSKLERSRGTAMMVDIARKAGVECWEIFNA